MSRLLDLLRADAAGVGEATGKSAREGSRR